MNLRNNKKAFTLIELSVVLIIISIFISAVAVSYQSMIGATKIKISRDNVNTIYNAISAYLKINHKLPCPASLELLKTDANYGSVVGSDGDCSGSGVVVSSANTNLVYGMVPIKALGLPIDIAGDGFDTKISYIVDKRFTALVDNTGTSGFEGSDPAASGMMEIRQSSATNTPALLSNVIMVIISHGQNKLGGFNTNSIVQNSTTGIGSDENTNIRAADFDSIFVISSNTQAFDDIVLYKDKMKLAVDANFTNMICRGAEANYSGTCFNGASNVAVSLTWNSAYSNEEERSNELCPTGCRSDSIVKYPARRCEKYGVWGSVIYPCK